MDPDAIQVDPEELRRNLAITLGTQPPHEILPASLRQSSPDIAAPAPIAMPQGPGPNLAIGSPAPNVKGPRGTLEADQAERSRMLRTGAGVDQIYGRVTGSQFGQAHPMLGKVLGGLGEGIAKAGDIGLSAAAPLLAINVPGTEYHHGMELNRLNRQIGTEEGEREKQAQTAEAQARTAAIPETGKRQDEQMRAGLAEHGLTMDEQGKIVPIPDEELSPALKASLQGTWKPVAGVAGPNGEPMEYNEKNGTYRAAPGSAGSSIVATDKTAAGNDFEQFYKDYLRDGKLPDTAANRKTAREQWAAASQAPQRAPQITVMVPNQQGGYTAEAVRSGQSVAPGAVTPAGMSSMNVPTAATRSMVEKAPKVVDFVDRSLQLIDENEKQLGPLAGRWSEFTAGKIGVKNKGYTQLRTDLGLLETALMNMHVGARGGADIMQHFHQLIDQSRQDPDNLRAALGEIRDYAQRTEAEGKQGSSGGGQAAPAAFKVKLADAMALPQNKGKSEADVEADVKKHGGELVR